MSRKASILLLAGEVLSVAAALADGRALGASPAELRELVLERFARFQADARAAGYSKEDVEDCARALAANIDELAVGRAWQDQSAWAREPLQVALYGERTSGRDFFERLGRIDAANAAPLPVFASCLALGYRGQFRLREDKIDDVLARVALRLPGGDRVGLSGSPSVSRPWARPRETPWGALCAGVLVVGLMIAFVIGYGLVDRAGDVVREEVPRGALSPR